MAANTDHSVEHYRRSGIGRRRVDTDQQIQIEKIVGGIAKTDTHNRRHELVIIT